MIMNLWLHDCFPSLAEAEKVWGATSMLSLMMPRMSPRTLQVLGTLSLDSHILIFDKYSLSRRKANAYKPNMILLWLKSFAL